jgi:hypothetical protein
MSITLRKHEISGLRLDKYFEVIENNQTTMFEFLDDIKIFMLKNNKTDKFLDQHYFGDIDDDTELSYNDYWHLREWYFFKDVDLPQEIADKNKQEKLDKIEKSMKQSRL